MFTEPSRSRPRSAGIGSTVAVMLATTALVLSGCSDPGAASTAKSSTSTSTSGAGVGAGTAQETDWEAPSCDRDSTDPPEAAPVKGSESDYDITSFDGTTIRAHWFPLSSSDTGSGPDTGSDSDTGSGSGEAPTVLMGPGWSQPGDVDTSADDADGAMSVLSINALWKAGYNVLTWDPRGFGESTGTVEIDSADYEGRDVSQLINWVAAQQGVRLDEAGDPRMGMVGASYGGGIQLVAAAIDCRVDAITPTIAWNSLATSLFKAETVKSGWADLLSKGAMGHELNPHITSADEEGKASGDLSEDNRQFFIDRGPDYLLSQVKVPTLIVQGTVDTLFTLAEADQNFTQLNQNDIPLAMVWYCGGHGICLNDSDPDDYVADAIMGWIDRYVKRDTEAPAVPTFQTVDQNAKVHTFGHYPTPNGPPLFSMATEGTLKLVPDGGSGPLEVQPDGGDLLDAVTPSITPAKATNALNMSITNGEAETLVLGAPDLRLGYSGTINGGATRPTRFFAQIVDDATGRVLGNQVTPVYAVLDGKTHMAEVPMEMVAFEADPGAELTLQLVASTVSYAVPQMDGQVDFSRIELSIPTVDEKSEE